MKNIVFLSGEDLLDVDMPVIKELNHAYKSEFDLTWIVILRNYGWFSHEEITSFCEENNIKLILLDQLGKLKNLGNILFYFKILKRLKKLNPDIIYDSYLGVPYMHFFRWLYLKKDKFVIAIHDVVQHYKRDNVFVRTVYDKFLINTYQNFHIFSEHQLTVFNELYKGKNAFFSPLYLKDFGEIKINEAPSNEVTTFLFFGIIRANKGLDLLIKAANKLGEQYKNIHVVIAGKCDDWDTYAPLIEKPENFTLKIRNIEKAEVPELFAHANFLVLPYLDVTQSGVLLSAYNYNLPVIASKFDWFEEYVEDNVNGYLFETGNADALAAKMETALKLSAGEYNELRSRLEKFIADNISVKAIAKKYADFFQTL